MRHTTFTIAIILCLLLPAQGQTTPSASDRRAKEAGLPFISWFSAQEYQGSSQVFSLAQDDRGVLYLGYGDGIGEYDGNTWRRIATPHNAVIRALAKGQDGRIYAGEIGDFGYLTPDQQGTMRFVSLLEFVPPGEREFQSIERIQVTPEGIYFRAPERLFRVTPDGKGWRVKSWKSKTPMNFSAYAFDTLYVNISGVGLHRLTGDNLEPLALPGLKNHNELRLMFMLPFPDGQNGKPRQLLLGYRTGELFVMDESGVRPFVTEATPLLKKLLLTNAIRLKDGSFGLGTLTGGFFILEPSGKVRRYLDRAAGIQSEGVLSALEDQAGTVWLGLQSGLAKVELASPLTEFGRATGFSGSVVGIARYRGDLYVTTITGGLWRLDIATGKFQQVPGYPFQEVLGLLQFKDSLLTAGAGDGIIELRGNRIQPIPLSKSTGKNFLFAAPSRYDPNRVWTGGNAGFFSLRWTGEGRWVDEGLVAKLSAVPRSIVEPEPGTIWVGTESQGVVRIRLQGNSFANPKVEYFGQAQGLADDGGVSVHLIDGHILFASPRGLREFDEASGRFVESKLFGAIPRGGLPEEYNVSTTPQGDIWVNFGVRPMLLRRQSDGTYKIEENLLGRISNGLVVWIHADPDGVLWMGGTDKIYRYDPAKASNRTVAVPALVRRVTAGEQGNLLLYAGSGNATDRLPTSLAFRDNSLRFEYAASSLEDPELNQFRSMLEGFDHDWSSWTRETKRDYTNLPPGTYRFRVKAKNALGQESPEAEYSLTILPPWYRTWWAYGAYAFLLAGLGFVVSRVQRRRVVTREREKSALREAQLRAETAAAQAKTLEAEAKTLAAENERNKNVELLSEIGKDLTSSLDLDTIFFRLYEHVNQLMDATIFGVGLYHPERHEIDYRLAMENGKRYAPYTRDTRDRYQFPVWCIEHRQPVFLNDVAKEYTKYIEKYGETYQKLEDGATATAPASMMYLPLMMKDRVLGVITVQSFKTNAYTDYHLDLLENLAAYTSIALDNADAYHHLKATQEQLVVQEKLASLGAMTAGIAHEIKNPLNFVNNFADLSVELMDELREDITKHKAAIPDKDFENIEDLLDDLTANAKKINEHGRRADGIVRSMLLHSRGQAGERQPTDINAMLEEYVNLTYHGMRAQDSSFNVTIERALANDAGSVEAIPQDLSRVFLNLLNNACYAVNDKAKRNGAGFAPKLRVESRNLGDAVEVRIRDNGVGIPPEVREKIFNPFFTTKPTGQGTGLGLSISHDIVVQQHGGQLEVETEPGEYTEFIVRLPRNGRNA